MTRERPAMPTPLVPTIDIVETPANLGVCNCCGIDAEDHTIKHVRFHWRDRANMKLAGGSAVALCRKCRATAAKALVDSLVENP
jgi:hypothetical protein